MAEFGEKLKAAREAKGMSQKALADRLYVTRQAVSRWENGARYPDLQMARRLSEILEVSLDELLSGEAYKPQVENRPVLEPQWPRRVEIMLLAFAAITSLMSAVSGAVGFSEFAEFKELFYDTYVSVVVSACGGFVETALLGWALVCSLRGRFTPRRVGIFAGAYYLLGILADVISRMIIGSWPPAILFSILIKLLYLVVISEFFLNGKRRNPLAVWLLAGWTWIRGIWSWVRDLIVIARDENAGLSALNWTNYAVPVLSILALFILQAGVLARKRRQQAQEEKTD